jgi:hypothetical protein
MLNSSHNMVWQHNPLSQMRFSLTHRTIIISYVYMYKRSTQATFSSWITNLKHYSKVYVVKIILDKSHSNTSVMYYNHWTK